MSKTFKGIFIDPSTQRVELIETDGDLDSMYKLIGCNLVEAVRLDKDNILWLDEEGWIFYKENGAMAVCRDEEGGPIYAGKGIILGDDGSGGHANTTFTDIDSVTPKHHIIGKESENDLGHKGSSILVILLDNKHDMVERYKEYFG